MNRLKQILSNPKYIFWYYIVVNLIPNFLLVFTEPLNIMGKLVLLLFPLGLYMVVFSLVKKTSKLQIYLILFLVLHAFQLVLMYLYGEDIIAADMFLNVLTTSPSEATELLGGIWPSILTVCVLYLPTIWLCIAKKKQILESSFRKKTALVGVLIMIISYGVSFSAKNVNTGNFTFYEEIYPNNMLYNLGFAAKKWNANAKYPKTSANFTFNAERDSALCKREIYVMVIGETSRADNWELYGYERNTNPKLSKIENLAVFGDAITQSNTTHKSVSIMLSAASAENYKIIYEQKSILEAFKEVGFTTVFLSNQAPNRTFTDYFAKQADIYKNIRSENGLIVVNALDAELNAFFKHYIDSIPNNLFIVLHTYGSHFNYRERYPSKFSVFKPDNPPDMNKRNKMEMVNAYDNTIVYTDYFLDNLISILDSTNTCSTLFFSSDHGEDILDDRRNRILHASPNPTYYQLKIPMFIWMSEKYREASPNKSIAIFNNVNKAVTTNSIFHTLLDIASIKTKYLNTDLALTNPNFESRRRMYLTDHDKPIFFYKVNLKKEDKGMMEKRGLFIE